ncbi:MAG: metal-dependent phosphohydrolase, partial [Thomasclavelia spiroformis]
KNSNLSDGIALSDEAHEIMKIIMKFNYENIYLIDRLKIHANYVKLILNSIFDFLLKYDKLAKEKNTSIIDELSKDRNNYPQIIDSFICWLEKYSKIIGMKRPEIYQNKIIYDFTKD